MAVSFVLTGGICLAWNYFSEGWFKYYVFDLPGNHTLSINRKSFEILWRIVKPTGLALIVSAFFFIKVIKDSFIKKTGGYNRIFYYVLISASMLGLSWAGMLNPGGYNNVLLPAYAWISVLFGLGLCEALKISQNKKIIVLQLLIIGLVFYQFYDLRFNVSNQIPTEQDRLAGFSLVEAIKNANGEVLIPSTNYLSLYAGKNTYFNYIALSEIEGRFGRPDKGLSKSLTDEILKSIVERQFSIVVTDNHNNFDPELLHSSRFTEQKIFSSPKVFIPVTGWDNRPQTFFISRP